METRAPITMDQPNRKFELIDDACKPQRHVGHGVLSFLGNIFIVVGIPMFIAQLAGWLIWDNDTWVDLWTIAGVVGGLMLYATNLKRLWLYAELYTGIVTINMVTGKPYPYGPGLHSIWVFEEFSKDTIASLEMLGFPLKIQVATNDDKVTFTVLANAYVPLVQLTVFVSAQIEGVRHSLEEIISSHLFKLFKDKPSSTITQSGEELFSKILDCAVGDIIDFGVLEKEVFRLPEEARQEAERREGYYPSLAEMAQFSVQKYMYFQFGIWLVSVSISELDFSTEVQEARSAEAEHERLYRLVLKTLGREDWQTVWADVASGKLSQDLVDRAFEKAAALAGDIPYSVNQNRYDVTVSGVSDEAAQAAAQALSLAMRRQRQQGTRQKRQRRR